MTFPGDEPNSGVARVGTDVVGEQTRSESEGAPLRPGPLRRLGRFLRLILRPLTAYPRVTIEAVLVVAALVVGLLILPTLSAASPGPTAVKVVLLERSSDVPTYLLFDDYGTGVTVGVGMDVPAGTKASWKLILIYNSEDSLTNRSETSNVSFAGNLSGSDIGTPGYQGVVFSGTLAGGSNSYTEFADGYFQRYSQKFNISGSGSADTGLPTDDAVVNFTISGPAQIATVSGANVAISLPTLLKSDSKSNQVSAPFNTEVFYDGGTYQAITGGATIQGGQYWDWFNHGIFPPTVATGVNGVEQQREQNNTFIAAAMFGLAAAAMAALSIEVVEAIQQHRRRSAH